MTMTIDQAIERFQRLVDSGWTCPIELITDGLNMGSVGGRDAPPDMVDKHFILLGLWARMMGQVTLRAQWFHPGQPSWVKKPLHRLVGNAMFRKTRIDLALKPFGQKYTPGAFSYEPKKWWFIEPNEKPFTWPPPDTGNAALAWTPSHEQVLGYWLTCLHAAKLAGVKLRYALVDHPPNMDKWQAGQSDELDAVITQRWELQLAQLGYVFDDPSIIVYGQSFAGVLPKKMRPEWLSHNGYNTQDSMKDIHALDALIFRQREEKLMWYHDVRRVDERDWGRRFADRFMEVDMFQSDRVDAYTIWPCIFSSPESITGVVELLDGIAGVRG